MNYICVKTGARLERREDQFYWRGKYFSGLIDLTTKGLYDNPDDSFNEHVGMKSSLAQGLITPESEE